MRKILILFLLLVGITAQAYRDLETGTFLTRDPIGYADGPNVYCYVHCNPITKFDPLGLNAQIYFGARTSVPTGETGWFGIPKKESVVPMYINVRIMFKNESEVPDKILRVERERYIKDAEERWSGRFGDLVVETHITVLETSARATEKDAENGHYNIVTFVNSGGDKANTGGHRAHMMEVKVSADPLDDQWPMTEELSRSFSHDFGHLLGIDDRSRRLGDGALMISGGGVDEDLVTNYDLQQTRCRADLNDYFKITDDSVYTWNEEEGSFDWGSFAPRSNFDEEE